MGCIRAFSLSLCAFLLAPSVFAQASASIVGAVRDTSDAAVPDAVTITNMQTGLTQTRDTSTDDSSSFPLLPVGRYRIEVRKQGYQRSAQDGIAPAVNDRLTIEPKLQVGAVSEAVTITAAPLVEAQTGTLRRLVDQQRMVSLPLNGRNMKQLVAIQAGVIQVVDNSANGEGMGFAVNGSRGNGVCYPLEMKGIPIRESLHAQFRAEFFNLLNKPDFGDPFATQSTPARFGRIESAGEPRIIQLGLKVLF
ncbi:MAG: carboxypeptidase regulatory-like domain-containing protein [Bryobacteraceae bacterium]|nr:carboxypeptidase-like regulatory domain-containing protein [Bryobacterales bacterium]MEB2364049.1 carboxypeptidase-like regulatory domain-containing protein [Bryobacterales bacterium]NUN00975.1 carboxypeptidase regulatory-like domain-containing protein [Bryobacteraceae bacterium]